MSGASGDNDPGGMHLPAVAFLFSALPPRKRHGAAAAIADPGPARLQKGAIFQRKTTILHSLRSHQRLLWCRIRSEHVLSQPGQGSHQGVGVSRDLPFDHRLFRLERQAG